MKFSERKGYTVVVNELEREWVSEELRNTLWSIVRQNILERLSNYIDENSRNSSGSGSSQLFRFFTKLWFEFFKKPVDEIPQSYKTVDLPHGVDLLRKWFFDANWFEVLDFTEFCCVAFPGQISLINQIFERERSAYRIVDGLIIELNSKEEIEEIENALNSNDRFGSVKEHLKAALQHYADRDSPDFRNSIKESISSVEALGKIITENPKATLGQALKEIEKKHTIPQTLKSAFDKLYGYSSNESGIRHALTDEGVTVTMAEARFMLVTCSAFVNYLISKNYS